MSVLVIDLDALKSGSCRSSGELEAGELNLEDNQRFGFSGPIRLDVRVSTTDQLSFYISGGLSYLAQGECRRCLKRITARVDNDLRGMYAFPDALDRLSMSAQERQEQGILPLHNNDREIDLTTIVRENLILEYPSFFQCDNQCKGICPDCGKDLGIENCDCREEPLDPRWSKLMELKNRK